MDYHFLSWAGQGAAWATPAALGPAGLSNHMAKQIVVSNTGHRYAVLLLLEWPPLSWFRQMLPISSQKLQFEQHQVPQH